MNPGEAVAAGRRAIEALMADACTITRTASTATNPDTAQVTRTTTLVYAGRCRFQDFQAAGAPAPKTLGGAGVLVTVLQMQLPVAVMGVQANDLVTCTAAALDPALVGRTWRARPVPRKTHATKTVIGLVEVTG